VATSVLPSPVRISAILPWCRTMPPIICTSKWRMPVVRTLASRRSQKPPAESRRALRVASLAFFFVGDVADRTLHLLFETRRARAQLLVRKRLH
jgi:hypothetical protein